MEYLTAHQCAGLIDLIKQIQFYNLHGVIHERVWRHVHLYSSEFTDSQGVDRCMLCFFTHSVFEANEIKKRLNSLNIPIMLDKSTLSNYDIVVYIQLR